MHCGAFTALPARTLDIAMLIHCIGDRLRVGNPLEVLVETVLLKAFGIPPQIRPELARTGVEVLLERSLVHYRHGGAMLQKFDSSAVLGQLANGGVQQREVQLQREARQGLHQCAHGPGCIDPVMIQHDRAKGRLTGLEQLPPLPEHTNMTAPGPAAVQGLRQYREGERFRQVVELSRCREIHSRDHLPGPHRRLDGPHAGPADRYPMRHQAACHWHHNPWRITDQQCCRARVGTGGPWHGRSPAAGGPEAAHG